MVVLVASLNFSVSKKYQNSFLFRVLLNTVWQIKERLKNGTDLNFLAVSQPTFEFIFSHSFFHLDEFRKHMEVSGYP